MSQNKEIAKPTLIPKELVEAENIIAKLEERRKNVAFYFAIATGAFLMVLSTQTSDIYTLRIVVGALSTAVVTILGKVLKG